MGATSSRIAKKFSNPFRSSSSDNVNETSNENALQKKGPHLVFSRRGSMYKDEDGDLAHEFYIEVPSTKQGGKATMKRIYDNLTPEGEVLYDIARLNSDFPNIISNMENPCTGILDKETSPKVEDSLPGDINTLSEQQEKI